MKNTTYILFAIIAFVTSCNTSHKKSDNEILKFNTTDEYPAKTLDIHDIADVEYILLQSKDSFLFTNFVYLSDNYITAFNYFEWNYVFFDKTGKPISNIARNGQGPEEYVMPLWIQLYAEDSDDFFIVTLPNRMQVYNKQGDYKRTLQLRGDSLHLTVDAIYNYDEDYLLCHDNDPSINYPFYLISKQTGLIKDINLYCPKKIEMSKREVKENGEFRSVTANAAYAIKNDSGMILNDYSSDTIFHLSKEMEIKPMFIRIPSIHNMKSPIFLTGFIETSRYLFFSTEEFASSFNKESKEKGYMLDKDSHTFYQVDVTNRDYKGQDLIVSPIKMTSLVKSECSSDPHVGVRALPIEKLREALDNNKLGGDLKELVRSSSDDDQFILMILRFR